jgi:hypothetical protein
VLKRGGRGALVRAPGVDHERHGGDHERRGDRQAQRRVSALPVEHPTLTGHPRLFIMRLWRENEPVPRLSTPPLCGFYSRMSDAPHEATDPATLPAKDGSSMSGIQLIAIMGVTLLAALIFLDLVSG